MARVLKATGVDTRYYWQLSRHIFRYNHRDSTSAGYMGGVHTVNECNGSRDRTCFLTDLGSSHYSGFLLGNYPILYDTHPQRR